MSLISLDSIEAEALANGFKVNHVLLGRGGRGIELTPPNYNGPEAHWHEGSLYKDSNIISIYDRTDYAYNNYFHGPLHDNYVQSNNYTLSRFRELLNS